MGAREKDKTVTSKSLYTCKYCMRLFRTKSALLIHERFTHSRSTPPKILQKKNSVSDTRIVSDGSETSEPIKTVNSGGYSISDAEKASAVKIQEEKILGEVDEPKFKCPVCNEKFFKYLEAYTHIQDLHPIDKNGDTVDPWSPNLIHPQPISGNRESGKSPEMVQVLPAGCSMQCAGCSKVFSTNKEFDFHIGVEHCKLSDVLFFANHAEFRNWKGCIEDKLKVKYQKTTAVNNKCYFTCRMNKMDDFTNIKNNSVIKFCPSAIVAEKLSFGFQVYFYKQHCGHTAYKINSIKATSIKKYLLSSTNQCLSENEDLYVKFQVLLGNVIKEAANVNIDALRTLYSKAASLCQIIEMVAENDANNTDDEFGRGILDSSIEIIEDDKEKITKKSKNYVPVQEVLPEKRKKRASTLIDSSPQNYFNSGDSDTPKILNTFSLNTDFSDDDFETGKITLVKNRPVNLTPKVEPSRKRVGADSFPQGLETCFPKRVEAVVLPQPTQILPNIKPEAAVLPNKIKTEITPNTKPPAKQNKNQSREYNDEYKSFIEKNFSVETSVQPGKKAVVKTKLGLFKPSSPRKSLSPKVYQRKTMSQSPKPETTQFIIKSVTEEQTIDQSTNEESSKLNLSLTPKGQLAKQISSSTPKGKITKQYSARRSKGETTNQNSTLTPKEDISKQNLTRTPKSGLSKQNAKTPKKELAKLNTSRKIKAEITKQNTPKTPAANNAKQKVSQSPKVNNKSETAKNQKNKTLTPKVQLKPNISQSPKTTTKRKSLSQSPMVTTKRQRVSESPKAETKPVKRFSSASKLERVSTGKFYNKKDESLTPKPTSKKPKDVKIPAKINYEVRERDDDCNILVLKF